MNNSTNLLGYDRRELGAFLSSIGEKPYRAQQILRWVHHFGEQDFDRMTDLPKTLQEKLKKRAIVEIPPARLEHTSRDGTRKWLLTVGNNNAVEMVFIPERTRGTLCVSSQVGCALACTFCSTGRQGFNRNLSAAEIIGQLWWANHTLKRDPKDGRIISNVVFMGMGEPMLNFENVVSALQLMLDDSAYGLSRRRVTVSTSGIVPAMDRLRQTCPVALAVSLHAPTDSLRDEIVPINKKYPLKELMQACKRYVDNAPRDFITFEYVMLQGVNDSMSCAQELIKLVKSVPCKFNLIPFNPFPRSGYTCSPPAVIKAFQVLLQEAGYTATIRKTRGEDIGAACGQLAGKVQDRTRRAARLTGVPA